MIECEIADEISDQGGYGEPYPQGTPQGYLQGGPVGFGEAISQAFKNILTFNGRASRSAYWWFSLFSSSGSS